MSDFADFVVALLLVLAAGLGGGGSIATAWLVVQWRAHRRDPDPEWWRHDGA